MAAHCAACPIGTSFLGKHALGFRFGLAWLHDALSAVFEYFLSSSKGGQEQVFLLKEKRVLFHFPDLCVTFIKPLIFTDGLQGESKRYMNDAWE